MTKVRGIMDRNRIVLLFGYDPTVISKVRTIPGFSFRKVSRSWAVPLDMPTARMLRKMFGYDFEPDEALLRWGREMAERERNLSSFSQADDYPLEEMRVYREAPKLAETLWPHQRADTMFMASTSCINGNEQGTGKTRVVASTIYEANMEHLPHLIVTHMVSPIEATWAKELEQWLDAPVLASESPAKRQKQIAEAYRYRERGEPVVLVLNKEMVRYVADYEEFFDEDTNKWKRKEVGVSAPYEELFEIPWGTLSVDEFHEVGLSNPKTLGARALADLPNELKFALSGTPMMGKPLRLWGALHWLAPKEFPSATSWADAWLEVEVDYFKHRHIGGIREDRREEFYRHLAPYMVRRLKAEVFPDLPPKEYEDVICKMTPDQAKQYVTLATEAELRIDEYHLTNHGVLDEYARLRIIATCLCTAEGKTIWDRRTREYKERVKLIATPESGKFPRLLEKLRECGVEPDEEELGALVVTTSRSVAEVTSHWLTGQGYRVATMIGGMKENVRDIQDSFQAGGPDAPNVIVMVDKKGGTSLTLDRADSVHILDEGWVPDVTQQAEDRAHRGSRMHRVRVFKYLMEGTIDYKVREIGDIKVFVNSVLDLRRKGFRAI